MLENVLNQTVEQGIFYLFAIILVLSSIRVITARNPVHAVLFLVLAFVTSSGLWLQLNVEFLALALIFVYVGAVMVLFLFVVMMLDIDVERMRAGFWKNLPLALALGLIMLIEILLVLLHKPMYFGFGGQSFSIEQPLVLSSSHYSLDLSVNGYSLYELGWILYTKYSYPVELASLVLLLGLVIAVNLSLRQTNKKVKYQDIMNQVRANPKERLDMVKMDPVIDKLEE